MRRTISALVLGVVLSGCGYNVKIPVPSAVAAKAVTLLNDAQAGVDFSYVVQWLNASEYGVATGILSDAKTIAESDPSPMQAIHAALVDAESRLAKDSKLRPYLDAVIQSFA